MSDSFLKTRNRLEIYFDQTAAKAWEALTADSPVSGIRARVRAGRDMMRKELLALLPEDLRGARVLDAGCGAGQIALELGERGAEVLGVDISKSLISVAEKRLPINLKDNIEYKVGDMLSKEHGSFDYVISMDSLIHYEGVDIARSLSKLSERTKEKIVFTIAPRTLLLSTLLFLGKVFPRSDRSPQIAPISFSDLRNNVDKMNNLKSENLRLVNRIKSSFYVSEALVLEL